MVSSTAVSLSDYSRMQRRGKDKELDRSVLELMTDAAHNGLMSKVPVTCGIFALTPAAWATHVSSTGPQPSLEDVDIRPKTNAHTAFTTALFLKAKPCCSHPAACEGQGVCRFLQFLGISIFAYHKR